MQWQRSRAGCVPSVHSTIPMASLPPFSLLCFLPQLLLSLLGTTVPASSVGLFEHRSPECPHGMEQTGVVGLVPGGVPGSLPRKAAPQEKGGLHPPIVAC